MEAGDTIGARKRHCKLSLPGGHTHDDDDGDDEDDRDNSVLGIYGLGVEFCYNHHPQLGDIKYQNNARSHIMQYKRKIFIDNVKCILNSEDKMHVG